VQISELLGYGELRFLYGGEVSGLVVRDILFMNHGLFRFMYL